MTVRPPDAAPTDTDDAAVSSSVERLSQMSLEEVDDLPYGFVVLDEDGVVLLYNRYEARMSRLPVERVIGRNFFLDIAPCTRVEAFYGRFRAFTAQPPGATERFAFRFHFLHGAQDVSVQFARAPDDRVFMTVHRRLLRDDAADAPVAIRQEVERGRLNSPLGALFPLTWDQVSTLLVYSGTGVSRDMGRRSGRAIAQAALREAATAAAGDEGALDEAPAQLAAALIDESFARLGMGRLACDFSVRPERVACFVRPPVECRSLEIVAFYEGLLESALSDALRTPQAARCIEGAELDALPWRFVLVPFDHAQEIRIRDGERPDDLARRFGLLDGIAG